MPITKQRSGFAVMPADQHRAVSRKAGQLSHLKSAAHEWTSDEAREAGRKGGLAKHANQRAKQDQETV